MKGHGLFSVEFHFFAWHWAFFPADSIPQGLYLLVRLVSRKKNPGHATDSRTVSQPSREKHAEKDIFYGLQAFFCWRIQPLYMHKLFNMDGPFSASSAPYVWEPDFFSNLFMNHSRGNFFRQNCCRPQHWELLSLRLQLIGSQNTVVVSSIFFL